MPLKLLHLCDTLFPIGSFAYSDGLEAAVEGNVPLQPDAFLRGWLDVCLDETIGRLDGPLVWRAWDLFARGAWEALATLDAESSALRPAAAVRKANRSMGLRLLTTWQALYPDERVERLCVLATAGRIGPGLPIAFAAAAQASGGGRRAAVEAFAYTRLAAVVSAAMRLMAIGQTDAHRLLARTLDRVPATTAAIASRDAEPGAFTPLVDIATMRHQYLHSRLFRT